MAQLNEVIPNNVLSFLSEIGITVKTTHLQEKTFLAGFKIDGSTLLIDPSANKFHAGDILHEAAHIALTDPRKRLNLNSKNLTDPAEEMAAHAWCWAAIQHLNLEPQWVFHSDYQADGDWLIDVFNNGGLLGQPLLEFWGLTGHSDRNWPQMVSWMR